MTWSEVKYVICEIDECMFDLTDEQTFVIAYDFLLTGQDHTTKNIEQFAMMKGAD